MRDRALIYVRGTDEQIETQLTLAQQVCDRREYKIAAILRDQPGADTAWHDAQRMVRHRQADLIIVASSLVVPDILESATGALPGPRLVRQPGGAGVHRATRRRRIRPVPRPGGAA